MSRFVILTAVLFAGFLTPASASEQSRALDFLGRRDEIKLHALAAKAIENRSPRMRNDRRGTMQRTLFLTAERRYNHSGKVYEGRHSRVDVRGGIVSYKRLGTRVERIQPTHILIRDRFAVNVDGKAKTRESGWFLFDRKGRFIKARLPYPLPTALPNDGTCIVRHAVDQVDAADLRFNAFLRRNVAAMVHGILARFKGPRR